MRQINLLLLLIGLFLLSSCAQDITVQYQTESQETGTVVFEPTKNTPGTLVTINDNKIVDDEHVKSLTIQNVPPGEYRIHYASNSSDFSEKIDEKFEVNMTSGREITKIVNVPPYSTGYYIYNGLALLSPFILLPIL